MALKAVVVGLGSIGRRHARLLAEREDIDLSFCEPNGQMLEFAYKEAGHRPIFPSFEAVLEASPDLVVIATPHDLHCRQAVAALGRGIHVLCEKPMSDRLADAVEMADAAERSAAVFSVGFTLHFHPGLLRVKEIVENGLLGEILSVDYRIGSHITLVNSQSRYQADMKGALLMDYAHQPDTIHWLTGRTPRGVYCTGIQGGSLPFTSDPNVLSLVCDYEAPFLSTIVLNYVQMPERQECEVIGDRGWVAYDVKRGELRIGEREANRVSVESVCVQPDMLYRAEHDCFLNAVLGRGVPSSPAADALVSMQVIDAALRSIKARRRVEFEELRR